MRAFFVACVSVGLLACGGGGPNANPDGGDGDAHTDASSSPFGDASNDAMTDGSSCDPPDMLVVLDRSDSMGQSAGKGADGGVLPSKWTLAQAAVEQITAAPRDQKLRFGLEVLPKVQGNCGTGDVFVPMDLGTGATIATTLTKTGLLEGTPIGGALTEATTTLSSVKVENRAQYVILVTDGGETCSSDGPLPVVQALAAVGVKTYVIGFGAAVDESLLNNLACAGLTASNFSTSCKLSGSSYVSAGGSTALYYQATDGTSLENALATITGGVCCGCVN